MNKIWTASREKCSSDFPSTQLFCAHVRPINRVTCLVFWLNFPFRLSPRCILTDYVTEQQMFWRECSSDPLLFVYTHYKKKAYSNKEKISPPKTENFQIKNSIFHISAQSIDCGYSIEPPRRGGANEYPQSMFLSKNKNNNVDPCKPQFYYIKVGFKWGQNYI